MKKEKNSVAEELKVIMTESLFKIKKLVETDPSETYDLLSVAKTFLLGVMTTTADLLEVTQPGSATWLYADIEAAAKKGRFLYVADLMASHDSYSVSDIAPDDFENGMNYVGQKLAETLSNSIHELPMPLRTLEMFLRGIEALLANLLNQKFNTPNDPHKILDNLCEHVHSGLNDLHKSTQNVVPIKKQQPTVDKKETIDMPAVKTQKRSDDDALDNLDHFLSFLVDNLPELGNLMQTNNLLDDLENLAIFSKPDTKAIKKFKAMPASPIAIPTDLKKMHQRYVECRQSLNHFFNDFHNDLMEHVNEASEELGNIDPEDGNPIIRNEPEMNVIFDYIALYCKAKGMRYIDYWLKQNSVDSYEHTMVDAFRNARFSVLRLDEYLPHGATKVVDLVSEKTHILMDNALSRAKNADFIFLCSTMDMKDFIMSTGGGVPIDMKSKGGKAVLTLLNQHIDELRKSKKTLTNAIKEGVKSLYGFCLKYETMAHHTVNTFY